MGMGMTYIELGACGSVEDVGRVGGRANAKVLGRSDASKGTQSRGGCRISATGYQENRLLGLLDHDRWRWRRVRRRSQQSRRRRHGGWIVRRWRMYDLLAIVLDLDEEYTLTSDG